MNINSKHSPTKDLKVNYGITARRVRLIGPDGAMIGVVSKSEALQIAQNNGLDLVEIVPNEEPPVCKILDYGKFKYEVSKKHSEKRRNQQTIQVKELKLRPTTEEHDYQVRVRNARKFLTDNNRVKFCMQYRGRELSHQEVGERLMRKILDDLSDIAKVDSPPNMEGRNMVMILSKKL